MSTFESVGEGGAGGNGFSACCGHCADSIRNRKAGMVTMLEYDVV
jgi:hypothetical protein